MIYFNQFLNKCNISIKPIYFKQLLIPSTILLVIPISVQFLTLVCCMLSYANSAVHIKHLCLVSRTITSLSQYSRHTAGQLARVSKCRIVPIITQPSEEADVLMHQAAVLQSKHFHSILNKTSLRTSFFFPSINS